MIYLRGVAQIANISQEEKDELKGLRIAVDDAMAEYQTRLRDLWQYEDELLARASKTNSKAVECAQ